MELRDKVSSYLSEERMEVGDFIKQTGSDYETYGKITKKQKNGSFKAVVFTSYDGRVSGKAKNASLKGWYPAPVKIEKSDIPPKILTKINDKLGK